MWEGAFKKSRGLIVGVVCGYLLFVAILVYGLYDHFNHYLLAPLMIGLLLYLLQQCYTVYKQLRRMEGRIAIFIEEQQIFWNKKRWQLRGAPFCGRHWVILPLRSLVDQQQMILCLMPTQMNNRIWRQFHFYLYAMIALKVKSESNDKTAS